MDFYTPGNEKRANRRFRLNHNALVVADPGGLRSNNIINISNGGMAFNYQSNIHPFMSEGSLDILIPDFVKLYQLKGVRFSTVYDQPSIYDQSCGCRMMRMQGVRFEGLSGEQNSQVLDMMRYYATLEDNHQL